MRPTDASNQAQRLADLTGNVHVFYPVIGGLLPDTYAVEAAPLLNGHIEHRKPLSHVTADGITVEATAVPAEKPRTLCDQESLEFVRDMQSNLLDQLGFMAEVVDQTHGEYRTGEELLCDKMEHLSYLLSVIETHIREHACEDMVIQDDMGLLRNLRAKPR